MADEIGVRMNLHGWIPVRIAWTSAGPRVEWILLGNERLLDPFFEQTLQRHMRHPFHHLFRRETSLEEMTEWTEANPGAPLKGIVYHMSRCGSTLLGRQFMALDRNIVASEPTPLDDLLRLPLRLPDLARATLIRWLRAMVAALAQPRNGEQAFYLKADCWHIHHIELLREAFPDTPWIFLYRDPVEVMVSQARIPAAWTVPGLVHPAALQMDWTDWDPAQTDVYCARALAKICQGGLRAIKQVSGGLLVNYSELPEATHQRLLSHFGLHEEDVPAMRAASQHDAKSPAMPFAKDASAKQAEASDRIRSVVATHLLPVYSELETERLASIAAAPLAI
jgi:hypothetical protein